MHAQLSAQPRTINRTQIYWGRTSVSVHSPVKGEAIADERPLLVAQNGRHKHTWKFESDVGS